MHLGDLLYEISRRRITLTCGHTGDHLNAKPAAALTLELIEEIKQHKEELIQVVREDEEMCRTGIIQSERQVFDLTREFFGIDDREGGSGVSKRAEKQRMKGGGESEER